MFGTRWRGTDYGALMADFNLAGLQNIAIANGRVARESQSERAVEMFKLARGEFQKTVELKPAHAVAHLFLAKVEKRLGQLQEASNACREAIRLSPSLAEAHFVMGEILLELKRPKDAIAPLEQAVRLALPDFALPKAALNRARREAMEKK